MFIGANADTCHFQKLNDDNSSSEHDFHWNSVPESIGKTSSNNAQHNTTSRQAFCLCCLFVCPTVCAFPYIIAFTADSIEVRLVINGNLIQSMAMPRLTLITSKNDVFFATTAPEFFNSRGRHQERFDKDPSPPSSPHCNLSSVFQLFFIQIPTITIELIHFFLISFISFLFWSVDLLAVYFPLRFSFTRLETVPVVSDPVEQFRDVGQLQRDLLRHGRHHPRRRQGHQSKANSNLLSFFSFLSFLSSIHSTTT